MTSPRDDPFRGPPAAGGRNGVLREVIGLLGVLTGLVILAVLLASVDWRLPIGLGALVLIGGGLWLGSGRDDGEV